MRWHIINSLINKFNYKDYLEIGIQNGVCFEQINIQNKEGVDVDNRYKHLTYHMSSDDFFKKHFKTYDIIFIDGNHEEEFATKDIDNALQVLNIGGTIVCHDCIPIDERMLHWGKHSNYTGTVYRSFIKARQKYNDLNMHVIDTDFGVGIITTAYNNFNKPLTMNIDDLSFNRFVKDKNTLLNVITPKDFDNFIAK